MTKCQGRPEGCQFQVRTPRNSSDNQANDSELKLCGSIFGAKGLLFPRVVIKAVVTSLVDPILLAHASINAEVLACASDLLFYELIPASTRK